MPGKPVLTRVEDALELDLSNCRDERAVRARTADAAARFPLEAEQCGAVDQGHELRLPAARRQATQKKASLGGCGGEPRASAARELSAPLG